MKNMKQQAGFTLIELVMVIVILGILSAFALPRFADLGGEARAASLQGAFGAIKSAAAIAHAESLVNNNPATVTLEGVDIAMVNGYPQALASAAAANGILAAAQIVTGAGADGDYDEVAGAAAATAAGIIVIQAKGAATPANCQISYDAADAGEAPVIEIDITDC